MKRLWAFGVDAYRGATQLNVIEPTNGLDPATTDDKKLQHLITHDPLEAKYLIDHVVYLPVNKHVSFYHLDKICKAVELALSQMREESPRDQVKLQSKL
jgi:ABC-type multidrug transport system ATPase subunit